MRQQKIGALILAGGINSRMGGTPKGLLTNAEGVRFIDILADSLSFPSLARL